LADAKFARASSTLSMRGHHATTFRSVTEQVLETSLGHDQVAALQDAGVRWVWTTSDRLLLARIPAAIPIDFVKIDKSFVHGLASPVARTPSSLLSSPCHALGLVVIAEGVETQSQLDAVKSLGCDRVQGFLLARPGEPGAVDERIRAGG
jgi:predicted signal transduction protein with EAL and GGDEF domain